MKHFTSNHENQPESSKSGSEKNSRLGSGASLLTIAAALALVILAFGVLFGTKESSLRSDDVSVQVVQAAEGTDAETEAAAEDETEAAETEATDAAEAATIPADGNPEDVTCKGSYTADDETAIAARDTVVATAGEYELTLGQLQVFYWMQLRSFVNTYSYYISYFGLDLTQSLDTQVCSLSDEGWTWQQFFLESSLNSWLSYCSMAAEADANGFELTEEERSHIENAAAELEETAQEYNYESGTALIHSSLGPAAEIEDYVYFMELYYKANNYYSEISDSIDPSDEELEAFYEEHAEGYEANGITKDSRTVDVRHILVFPEGADSSTISTEEFSEEAWNVAAENAQAILDEFLAGDKTEDSFAALANERSEDTGSNTNGGLYEDVTEGEMVTEFNDWCFDEARAVGDTGIVKTSYGYHVMYFSGSSLLWKEYALSDYVQEKANDAVTAATEKYPLTVQYADILIANAVLE